MLCFSDSPCPARMDAEAAARLGNCRFDKDQSGVGEPLLGWSWSRGSASPDRGREDARDCRQASRRNSEMRILSETTFTPEPWAGFIGGAWRDDIDVRDFI